MCEAPVRSPARHVALGANVLVPGLYAWLTTVAVPAARAGASAGARAAAYAALRALWRIVRTILLVVGVLLVFERPGWARGVGVVGFVGLCLLSWILLGSGIDLGRIHPVRACCGGVGWALYAVGWGSVHPARCTAPSGPPVPSGSRLAARGRLPGGAAVVLGIGVVGALLPWLWAWRVARPVHAVLAHGVALLVAVVLVSAAAHIALERGRRLPAGRPRSRLRAAAGPLSAVALLLAAGLTWWALR